MSKLAGLTDEETEALRTIFALTLGRDRVARRVRRHLDGDDAALAGAPTLRAKIDEAATVIREKSNAPKI